MKNRFTFLGKFSLALIALACFGQLNAQSNLILTTKIQADSDDAEEQGLNGSSPGTIDLTSSDIELVEDGNDGNQFVGLRFASLNLPKDAIIDSAFIQFTVDETNTGATTVIFKVEDIDSSATFSSTNGDISSRNVSSISKTAPYMHNGAYNSLNEVIEFYDDGGGNGLGFDLDFQTLPADSLHLTELEIQDLIAFLNSLEDQFPL